MDCLGSIWHKSTYATEKHERAEDGLREAKADTGHTIHS